MHEADKDPFPKRPASGGLKRRAVFTMMIHIGISISAVSASTVSDQSDGGSTNVSVTLAEFARDRVIIDSGAQRGQDAAAIPLTVNTVDAPDGAQIEVRFVRADTGTEVYPWRALGTLSAGTLSGTYFQPTGARSAHWLRPQARVVGSSAVTQTTTTCGVGHVWAIWGQSEWGRIVNLQNGEFMPAQTVPDDDFQFLHWTDDAITKINATTMSDGTLYAKGAVVDMANALHALRPGEKFAVGFFVKGASSSYEALTTAAENPGGTWLWEDNVEAHNVLTGGTVQSTTLDGITQVGTVWIGLWAGSHQSELPNNLSEKFIEEFLNLNPADGTPFDTTSDSTNRTFNINDGGLYDFTYSRLGMLGPMDWKVTGAEVNATAFTSALEFNPDRPGRAGQDEKRHGMVLDFEETFNNNPVPAIADKVLPWVGAIDGAERGRLKTNGWDDYAHYYNRKRDQGSLFLRMAAFNALKSLGLHSHDLPALNRRFDEPSGAWIDFGIDGVDVETYRRFKVQNGLLDTSDSTDPQLADPSTGSEPWAASLPQIHHAEIVGFSQDRYPVERADIHTITAQDLIDHPGHFASVGQRVARVYPIPGYDGGVFKGTQNVVYGFGGRPFQWSFVDEERHTWMDMLYADMGQPDTVNEVLPVQWQGILPRLRDMTPTTLNAPDFFQIASGNAQIRRSTGINFAAGVTSMIWVFKGIADLTTLTNDAPHVISFRGGDVFMTIDRFGGVKVKNNNDVLDLAPITNGQYFELRAEIDLGGTVISGNPSPGSKMHRLVNHETGEVLKSITSPGQNGFTVNSDGLSFFSIWNGNDPFRASYGTLFSAIEVYIDKADTSGTPDYAIRAIDGSPHYELIGFSAGDIRSGTFGDGQP